jgi:SanA protein
MKFKIVALIITIGLGLIMWINLHIVECAEGLTYHDASSIGQVDAVLLLGASVFESGRLSDILSDRADEAISIYEQGKAKKILVSGDHGQASYDEVNSIKKYLLDKGVPAQDIFLDHAGFDTYDSLYRAKAIFKVEKIIIATQKFHLARAVYIGAHVGLDVYGIPADRHEYQRIAYFQFREIFARVKAFFDVQLNAQPKYLGEQIPITGSSTQSWD